MVCYHFVESSPNDSAQDVHAELATSISMTRLSSVDESFTPRFYDVVLGEFLSASFFDAVKLSLGTLDLS